MDVPTTVRTSGVGVARGNGGAPRSGNSNNPNAQSAPWVAGYNPWQGMVQAWPMPFRAPGAGVLGPRPPFLPQQAMTATHMTAAPPGTAFDPSALYAALPNAGVPDHPPNASEWYFDTGASSHMLSSPGNFPSSSLRPSSSSITVGNGARLPIKHQAHAIIPTATSPLHLNDVLVSPHLIKNLISVRRLTRDNNVSIEFDPSGFSIKALTSRAEML